MDQPLFRPSEVNPDIIGEMLLEYRLVRTGIQKTIRRPITARSRQTYGDDRPIAEGAASQ
jgi:hypothetical protein